MNTDTKPADWAPEAAMVGHIETRCAVCDREWIRGQDACKCGSRELVTRHVDTAGGWWRPKPQEPPKPTPEQLESVRTLGAAVRVLRDALRLADPVLRDAVRSDVAALAPLHGAVHSTLATAGDTSPAKAAELDLGLGWLDHIITTTLEETK